MLLSLVVVVAIVVVVVVVTSFASRGTEGASFVQIFDPRQPHTSYTSETACPRNVAFGTDATGAVSHQTVGA